MVGRVEYDQLVKYSRTWTQSNEDSTATETSFA